MVSFNRNTAIALLLLTITLLFASCKDSGVGSSLSPTMSVKVNNLALAKSVIPDSITIDTAKILLRKIKLESSGSADSIEVYVNSVVVDLDLTGSLTSLDISQIPNGSYSKVKFNLHKPEDAEVVSDPEFKPGSSGSDRYSVIIKGIYHGSRFLYRSRINVDQEVVINPPLVVNDTKKDVNVTIIVNPQSWFGSSTGILDPTNPSNEGAIDDNIKNSFKSAFQDNNKDGELDGSGSF